MAKNYRHTLTYNGTSKVLGSAPGGWDTSATSFFRSSDYFGISRSVSLSNRFFKLDGLTDSGGYQFFLNAFDNEGIKASIEYTREKYNGLTDDFDPNYTGVFDLTPESGFTIDKTNRFIEAKVIDSSKQQSVNANEEKKYELSSLTATNGNAVTAFSSHPKLSLFPAVDLYLQAFTLGNIDVDFTFIFNTVRTDKYDYTAPVNRIGDRLIDGEIKVYENTTDSPIDLTFDIGGSYNVTWGYSRLGTPFGGEINQKLTITLYNSADTIVTTYTYFNETVQVPAVDSSDNFTGSISDSQNFTIQPNYYLVFKLVTTISDIDNYSIDVDSVFTISSLNFTERYVGSNKNIYTWLTYEMFTRLFQLMTGEADTSKLLYSTVLGRTNSEFQTYPSDGRLAYLATVNGNVIRGNPEGKTKVSFKDAFSSVSNLGNIAMWYDRENDRYRIEDKVEVFRNDEIFDLGEVSNFKITPYNKAYFSQLLTGTTEKGDYEQLQGAQEYNIQSEHSIDMPVNNKLDIRSKLNTDTLGIVLAKRSDFSTEGLSDTKEDNKTYIVELNNSLTVIVNSDIATFTGFEGIDQYYNGNYTPRQCIKNNANWIMSLFYKETDGITRFVNNTKDIEIFINNSSNQDSLNSEFLDAPLYFPEIYEIEFKAGTSFIKQMETDPHGYITFSHKGEEFNGFWLEGEIEDYKGKGKAKLIRANLDR